MYKYSDVLKLYMYKYSDVPKLYMYKYSDVPKLYVYKIYSDMGKRQMQYFPISSNDMWQLSTRTDERKPQ